MTAEEFKAMLMERVDEFIQDLEERHAEDPESAPTPDGFEEWLQAFNDYV